MSQVIPEGWALAKLDELISYKGVISDGDWVESKDQDPEGSIRLIQLADIGDGEFLNKSNRFMNVASAQRLNCTLLKENDVLIARMPDPLGRACLFPKIENEAVTVVDVCLIRLDDRAGISPKVLMHWINSSVIRNVIALEATGTTRKRITRKKLSHFDFPLPPLAEQKVIADKLDELLAQVESTKVRLDAIPAILKSFRQSVLAAAVSGKLTEEWRDNQVNLPSHEKLLAAIKMERFERWVTSELEKRAAKGIKSKDDKWKDKYPEPISHYSDPLNRTNINDIPDHWLKTNLDTVSILTTGKTPSTTNEANWNGNLPFISPAQVHKNGHILEPARYVSELGAKTVPVVVKDSILIVCIGTVGKVGILDSDAVINQQLNAITPLPMVLSNYMFYWSKILYPWIIETSRATVNAAIINKSRLSEAPFALPSLEEQTEIVRRVEELFAFADKVEAQVNAAQTRVNNLTQSILAKAFRGELTADWRAANPELISGENSAEALLKRIKAERAKLKPTKKTKA